MNQRQWIQMDDLAGSTEQKVSRISWTLVAIVTVVFALVGAIVSFAIEAAALGFIVSFLYVRSLKKSGEPRIREALDMRPASEDEQARVFNVVDGLCVVSGDHRPAIAVTESAFPLALALGNASESTIVVSTGFCEQMDRVETEAVMAHLLWRIRSGETELTAYLINLTAQLTKLGLGSIARRLVERATNVQAILWADIAACQATRYPPALVSALEKVQSSAVHPALDITAPLWFATPAVASGATIGTVEFPNLGVSYPSLAERIGVLKEI